MSEKSKALLTAALPAAMLAALLTYFLSARQTREQLSERDRQHGVELAKLREAEESARGQMDALRRQLESAGVPVAPAPAVAAARSAPENLEVVRQLAGVQKQMAELSAGNRELQARAVELQAAVEKLSGENKRMAAETEDLREALEKTRRVVSATEAELTTKTERLVQLEAALARSREERTGATAQVRSVSGLLREFEELNRRRENTLANLQRRYRELTDLYRSTLLTIEQQRDNPAIRQLPDASRIQATVLAAEDDLRQVNALNTQAQRLAQKLQAVR
jgi:chromosome segregation ATPase